VNFKLMFRYIVRAGAVAMAIIALIGFWHTMGWDTPAWSSDVKRLDRQQTENAIDIYARAQSDAIITQELLKDPSVRALNQKRIDDATETLKQLRQHKIELSK